MQDPTTKSETPHLDDILTDQQILAEMLGEDYVEDDGSCGMEVRD